MKKSSLVLTILISVFMLTLNSCKKDKVEVTNPPASAQKTGSYQVYLDGVLFEEGTNAEVGLIKDDQGNYVNNVTIGSGNNFGILVSGFPRTVNGVENNDTNGDPGVTITSGALIYSTNSGTMTRTSARKITFEGSCTEFTGGQVYTISGFVESEALEVIN